MTRNKLASIFNVDVKTIGNWINELSSRDEYQNIIGQLSTIFPDEDKSAIEKILIIVLIIKYMVRPTKKVI